MIKNRLLYRLILFFFVFFQFSFLFLAKPKVVDSVSFTSASDTLSNSRLSYRAGVASGTLNSVTITIDGSDNADINTNHLFPKDSLCFTDEGLNGCIGDTTYTVNNINDSTTFNVTSALGNNLDVDGYAVASQSATHTIAITLANDVPANGDILITIPAVNVTGKTNDGFPDTSSAVSSNGFDLGGLTTSNVSVNSSGCDNNWSVAAVNAGDATNDHTIRIDRSTNVCSLGSIVTITIGDGSQKLINPAPILSSHIQGNADIYTINVKTRDGSDIDINNTNIKVAPVEAVLVSATVEEALSFRICGVKADLSTQESGCFSTPSTICDQASLSAASYAYSLPFGTIATADTFVNLAQYLKVTTNADNGYTVKIEQNDQMGKDGITCTGNPTNPATTNCIPDNPGDSTLDYNTSDDCDTAATNGLCFSQDVGGSGSPTLAVKYDVQTNDCDVSPTFCARSAADQESSEVKQTIFSYNNPTSGDDVFVCWRLSVDGTQPAGYYYNRVKYTATASF